MKQKKILLKHKKKIIYMTNDVTNQFIVLRKKTLRYQNYIFLS